VQGSRIRYRNMLGEDVEAILLAPPGAPAASSATAAASSLTLTPPFGAVICLDGTSGDASRCTDTTFQKLPRTLESSGPLRGWAAELTRRGFVTLSITLRGHDRRNGSYAEKTLGEQGAYRRLWETQMKLMAPLGQTMMGVMVDEVLRGIDILPRACASVDPSRIAVAGFSLGGNVAWYSAACSSAIAACAPLCGGLGSLQTQIDRGNPDACAPITSPASSIVTTLLHTYNHTRRTYIASLRHCIETCSFTSRLTVAAYTQALSLLFHPEPSQAFRSR